MLPNLAQGHDSLFKLEVAPPLLNSIRRSTLNDHVDGVLFERSPEEGSSNVLLTRCDFSCTVKQGFEKAKELLVFSRVDSSVVVQNGEQDGQNQFD